MVKRATSLFNSFGSNVARQIARFCCLFFRTFRSDNYFQVLFGPIFALGAKIETQLSSNYVSSFISHLLKYSLVKVRVFPFTLSDYIHSLG